MLARGTRVRYIRMDTADERLAGYYPPIGTLGTIFTVDNDCYEVKWDSGTDGDGIWWCEHDNVEEVPTGHIYTFRENDVIVSGEKHHLVELAEKLREVGIEGTWSDLIYQIEYEFDIDGVRTDDPEYEKEELK